MTILASADVAKRLDIPESTLDMMRRQGRGPAHFRVGRHVRFTEQAVEDWIAEQVAHAATTASQ